MDTPLRLESYFFPYVEIAADAQFDPSAETPSSAGKPDFQVKVSSDHNGATGTYQVSVAISLEAENEENRLPYSINLVAIGLFKVDKEWPDPVKLLEVNGASILYSSAREFVITVTSRGPWNAISLPMMSFLKIYEEKHQKEEEPEE